MQIPKDMTISFLKMQAVGNSFLLIEKQQTPLLTTSFLKENPSIIKRLCSKSYGLGTDGLVLWIADDTITHTDNPLCQMHMYNTDGSRAELCGNALLCVGRLIYEASGLPSSRTDFVIRTDSGDKYLRISHAPTGTLLVEIDMGIPVFADEKFHGMAMQVVRIGSRDYFYVSMGNPHAVCFVDDFDFDYVKEGKAVSSNQKWFPEGVNVEYVRVLQDGELEIRVWERGYEYGETFGCGTGACAVYVMARIKEQIQAKPTWIHLRGGKLFFELVPQKRIRFDARTSHAYR